MPQSHHTECRLNLPTQVGNFQQVTHSSQYPLISILYALYIISIICHCSAVEFGLLLNMKKTQFMTFNITHHTNNLPSLPPEDPTRRRIKPHILSGHVFNINQHEIEEVNDFKYLGSYIRSTLHDISVRKAQAMAALHSMDTCWKSSYSELLLNLFYSMDVRPGQ